MKFKSIFYLLLAIAYTVNAQPSNTRYPAAENPNSGKIRGSIYDSQLKKPMEFSSVALFRTIDSSLVTGTISANDGSFSLSNIPFGKYYLVANFMGFEKNFVNTIILSKEQSVVDVGIISLVAATQNLDEIEVVATQNRIEYKIDRKVINVSQDLNAAGGSAAEVLQNTPSVTVDIDGNVSLRGSSNFTVLIDGKPTPLSGSDALQQIPASAIENIEIITNPSAKFDPDGMAGIINIVMKKNSMQGLSGIFNTSIGTGDKYSGDFLLNYKTKKYNVFGGINFQDKKNGGSIRSLRTLNPGEPVTPNILIDGNRNHYHNNIVFKGGADFYLNDKNTLTIAAEGGNQGHNSDMRTKMHSYTTPASYDTFDISEGIGTHQEDYYSLDVNYTKTFDKPRQQLVASVFYQAEDGAEIDEENEFPTDQFYKLLPLPADRVRTKEAGDDIEFRAKFDYTQPVSTDGLLETGYQMRLDKQDENYLFENYDPDTELWINNLVFSSGNYFNRQIHSAYATFSNKLGKYEYMLGLRGEYTNRSIRQELDSDPFTLNRLDYFPTFHLSRQFQKDQQLLASYSRRINRPWGGSLEPFRTYMNSYTLREGNPKLKPEYVNSVELSYQKNFGQSFFVVESYFRNTQDMMTRISTQDPALPDVVILSMTNLNNDYSAGAEFMLNLSVKKWLNINSSVNIYKYWLDGVIDGVQVNRNSNNWDTRLNSSFFINTKSRVQLNFMYNGPSVTAQGDRKAFYVANIAYRRDFLDRKLSAIISLQDIFGTSMWQFTSYTPTVNSSMRFEREHQVVTLTLSYKLNNFKNKDEKRDGAPEDMDDGGMF